MIISADGRMKLPPSRMPNGWHNISVHPLVSDWRKNWFLPNVKAWRPSAGYRNGVHTYLTGWFGILALDHIEDVILNDNRLPLRSTAWSALHHQEQHRSSDPGCGMFSNICRIALSDGRQQLTA